MPPRLKAIWFAPSLACRGPDDESPVVLLGASWQAAPAIPQLFSFSQIRKSLPQFARPLSLRAQMVPGPYSPGCNPKSPIERFPII